MALLSIFISTGFVLKCLVVTPIINKQRDAMLEGDDTLVKNSNNFICFSCHFFGSINNQFIYRRYQH